MGFLCSLSAWYSGYPRTVLSLEQGFTILLSMFVTEHAAIYEYLTSRLLLLASPLPWATTITSSSTAICPSTRLPRPPLPPVSRVSGCLEGAVPPGWGYLTPASVPYLWSLTGRLSVAMTSSVVPFRRPPRQQEVAARTRQGSSAFLDLL